MPTHNNNLSSIYIFLIITAIVIIGIISNRADNGAKATFSRHSNNNRGYRNRQHPHRHHQAMVDEIENEWNIISNAKSELASSSDNKDTHQRCTVKVQTVSCFSFTFYHSQV